MIPFLELISGILGRCLYGIAQTVNGIEVITHITAVYRILGTAVLIKGGHLEDEPESDDFLRLGNGETLRLEFDHNQSQQVYVSEEVWDMIINVRDQTAAFVISIAAQVPTNATAQTYATALLTAYASNGTTPTDKALEELKNEAKSLM